ncbi:MAG: hypothetical protein MN733_42155, partial [Nitrososphaera sp.]|nr:hypothetical protein [Nitrososphaera sp.]
LKAGNTWTYTRVLYDSDGNVDSSETVQHAVQLAVDIEDERWYQTNFAGFLANRADGIWRRTLTILYGGERHFGFPGLHIPYPLDTGGSVKVSTFYTYTLLEKGVAVTVPAGTFLCHHYRVRLSTPLNGIREYHRYYAPGVGFVKERWDAETDLELDMYEGITWYAGELLLEKAELK